MPWLEGFYLTPFLIFTFVLARVSGLVMTAPTFTGTYVPMQVRAFLAIGIAAILMPTQWGKPFDAPGNLADYAILMAGELLIGVILGMGIAILAAGLQLSGQVIAQMSGMALADVLNPGSDNEVPIFASMLYMVGLAVFVVIGGHRALIDALMGTFTAIPIGHGAAIGSLGETVSTLMAESFALGLRAAAPAMVALLLATLVLGLIGRTLPQLNVLVLGFGINSLITLAALFVSVGAVAWLFQEYFDPVLKTLLDGLTRTT
jgi:flagellar biosynthesis protein FliR